MLTPPPLVRNGSHPGILKKEFAHFYFKTMISQILDLYNILLKILILIDLVAPQGNFLIFSWKSKLKGYKGPALSFFALNLSRWTSPSPPPSTVKTSWVHVIWNWRISWPLYLRRSTKYEHYSEKINPMCTFMVGPISPPGIEKSAGSIIHFWIRCAFEVALLLYLEIKPMKIY